MERRRTPQVLDVIQVEIWVDAKKVQMQNFVGCYRLEPYAMARSGHCVAS
jgi:hypothetical protein